MSKEKMTLQEVMETIADDVVVHIGAKTAFFFIGTKAEYEANIDLVQQDLQARTMISLEESRNRADFFKEKILNPDEEAGSDKYWKLLADRAYKLSKLYRAIPKLEDYLDTFVAVREREVLDQYDRLLGDGIVIVVDGKENGRYWLYEEYQKGVSEDDLEGEDGKDEE